MSGFNYSRFDKIVDEDAEDRLALLKSRTRFEPSGSGSGPGADEERTDADEGLVPYETEMHATEAEVLEIRSLKQTKSEIWQVAVCKLRCWLASEGGADEADDAAVIPVRPYTLFVSCVHPTGRLLTRYVAKPPQVYPSPRVVLDWLLRAMLDPQGPVGREEAHRPGAIAFTDPALGSHLAKTLSEFGIQTSYLTPSPGLSSFVKGLSKVMVRNDIAAASSAGERDGMASVRGVTEQLLKGFYRLSREFAQAQPWRFIKEQQTFRVWRIPDSDAGGADIGSSNGGRCFPGDTMSQCIEAGATAWIAVMGDLSVTAARIREGKLAKRAARKMRREKRKAKREQKKKEQEKGKGSGEGQDEKKEDSEQKDDDAASFHSFSSDEREHGDSDREDREEELEELEDDQDDEDTPIATTRGLCVFFSRTDAEQRLLSAPALLGTAAQASGAGSAPASRPHPLEAKCAHCGKRGREWFEAIEEGKQIAEMLASTSGGATGDAAAVGSSELASTVSSYYLPSEKDATASTTEEGDAAAKLRKLQRCGGCRNAYYCGAACQREAWSKHSGDCKKSAASLKAGWASSGSAAGSAARYWGERELVLLLEESTSLPFDDLDWYEEKRLQQRRAAERLVAGDKSKAAAAADVSPQDAFYPNDLPLALTFHRGSPSRPSPSDLAWLMRGMAVVMAMTGTGAGSESTTTDDDESSAASLRLLAHNLKPTLRPVSLKPDFRGVSSSGTTGAAAAAAATTEPWFVAAGEALGVAASKVRPPLLQVLADPMLPVTAASSASTATGASVGGATTDKK